MRAYIAMIKKEKRIRLLHLMLAEPTEVIQYGRYLLFPLLLLLVGVATGVCESVPHLAIQLGVLGGYSCLFEGAFGRHDRHWSVFLIIITGGLFSFGVVIDLYNGTLLSSLGNSESWLMFICGVYRMLFLVRVWCRSSRSFADIANRGVLDSATQ